MANLQDTWIRFCLRHHLEPKEFEILCLELLKTAGHQEIRHFGSSGSEGGIDLWSRRGGEYWVHQCKRVRRPISKTTLQKEVRKVRDNWPSEPPSTYHLLATHEVSRDLQEALEAELLTPGRTEDQSKPLELGGIWDISNLVSMLRAEEHRETLGRFVGPVVREKLPFWNVPNRNEYFTGREDLLSELAERLHSERSAVLTQAITGLGGVGKTQTAIEFCHRHRDSYPGGVFWTVATSAEALEAGFAKLAAELSLVDPGTSAEEAANAFRRELSRRESWLLVLDNADSNDDLGPLLPETSDGQVLVTTRLRVTKFGPPLGVEVLPEGEAIELLLARSGRGDDERRAAADLAHVLGYLPLALEQAGAFLSIVPMPVATYLEDYRQRRLATLGESRPEAGDYHSTVSATWTVSFETLRAESDAAAAVLEACAFLAPGDIPLEILELGGAWIHQTLVDLGDFGRQKSVVGPLTRYSLATYDTDSETLSVHRLVQEVIREELEQEGRTLEVLQGIHQALDASFPRSVDSPQTWPAAERLLPHVQAGVSLWEPHLSEEYNPTMLWQDVGSFLWITGRNRAAADLDRHCLSVRQRIQGPEHPDTLTSMNNLATNLQGLGDLTGARDLHESELEVCRRVFGPEHPATLMSMNNLGVVLRGLGDLAGARDLHESVLEIRQRIQGPEHPYTLASMNNLGAVLRDLDDLHGAHSLVESVLEIHRRVLGPEHPETLRSIHNLLISQRDSPDLEIDRVLRAELLAGVQGLPEGVPIRETVLRVWGEEGFSIPSRSTSTTR